MDTTTTIQEFPGERAVLLRGCAQDELPTCRRACEAAIRAQRIVAAFGRAEKRPFGRGTMTYGVYEDDVVRIETSHHGRNVLISRPDERRICYVLTGRPPAGAGCEVEEVDGAALFRVVDHLERLADEATHQAANRRAAEASRTPGPGADLRIEIKRRPMIIPGSATADQVRVMDESGQTHAVRAEDVLRAVREVAA